MAKKFTIGAIVILIIALIAILTFSIVSTNSSKVNFTTTGEILLGDNGGMEQEKSITVTSKDSYTSSTEEYVKVKTKGNGSSQISSASFVVYDDGSIISLCDGTLVDFNDFSDNFINNYYIKRGMALQASNGIYTVQTASGTLNFGEYLLKISDNKYLIRSEHLKVYIAEGDVREAENFVQVTISDEGIAQILTSENLWMTISETCYIETKNGVKIYPMTQIIDNGTYRMSIAKISITMDDAIVLTAAETRNQIIPKFIVNVIDGTNGRNGSDGGDGGNGLDGGNGGNGTRGSNGADASTTSSTNTVLPTMTISDWQVTSTSLKGTITISDEANHLRLEDDSLLSKYYGSVTIIDAQTGEEYVCFEATTNNYETLSSDQFLGFNGGGSEVFFASCSGDISGDINYNVLTPDTTYILSVKAYYTINGAIYQREFIRRTFSTDSAGFFLSEDKISMNSFSINATVSDSYYTKGSVTEAKIYLMTPEQAESFSYLDVAGVNNFKNYIYKFQINYSASVNKVTGSDKNGGEQFDQSGVNQTESLLFVSGTENYNEITANTDYVLRAVVTNTNGDTEVTSISSQVLKVKTLKNMPMYYNDASIANGSDVNDSRTQVSVIFNRYTGAFEVYRPALQDPNKGIESYTYTAYNKNKQKVKSVTVNPGDGEPVQFFLETGIENVYTFGVDVLFNDNQKSVYYDLGQTAPIYTDGISLPSVSLRDSIAYSSEWQGRIVIKDKDGSLFDDFALSNNQLQFRLYNGNWFDGTFYFQGKAGETVSSTVNGINYTISYPDRKTSSMPADEIWLDVTIDGLRFDTNYKLDIIGSVDVYGSGTTTGVRQTLGTVGFMTIQPPAANVTFTDASSTSNDDIDVVIKVSFDELNKFDLTKLSEGSLTLKFYQGTSADGVQQGGAYQLTGEDMELLTTTGVHITNSNFTSKTLSSENDYAIVIVQATDDTYDNTELDPHYTNEYTNCFDKTTFVIQKAVSLPSLPGETPEGGLHAVAVTVADIINGTYAVDASKYSNLPSDAVVGYTLTPTFSNTNTLGRQINFYGYEYGTFYRTLEAGIDPVGNYYDDIKNIRTPSDAATNELFVHSIEMDKDSTDVPKLLVLFGEKPEGSTIQKTNGYYVFYAGDAVIGTDVVGEGDDTYEVTTLKSGMDRGFRYVFCYTVQYDISTEKETILGLYPYGHSNYETYKNNYGIGQQVVIRKNAIYSYQGAYMFRGVAYLLNSGIQSAPYVTPTFQTFVTKLTNSFEDGAAISDGSVAIATGQFIYSYYDPDKVIKVGAGVGSEVTGIGAKNYILVDRSVEGETANWGMLDFTGRTSIGGKGFTASVNCSLYQTNYDNILKVLYDDSTKADSSSIVMGHIMADWAYEDYYNAIVEDSGKPQVLVDMSNAASGYIDVIFNNANATNIGARAAALYVKLYNDDVDEYYEGMLSVKKTSMDASGYYYSRIQISDLPSALLGHTLSCTAKIYYDSGDLGWYYAVPGYGDPSSTDNYFVLQTKVRSGQSETFSWAGWYIASNSTAERPSGGLMLQSAQSSSLILSMRDSVTALHLTSRYPVTFNYLSGDTFNQYLYPQTRGITASIQNTVIAANEAYLLPKRVASIDCSILSKGSSTISYKTPRVVFSEDLITTTGNKVFISQFKINDIEESKANTIDIPGVGDCYIVYAGIYEDNAHARNLVNSLCTIRQYALNSSGEIKAVWDGSAWDTDIEKYLIPDDETLFADLDLDTKIPMFESDNFVSKHTYSIAIYMQLPAEDTGYVDTIMIDSETKNKAIYGATTKGDITVAVTEVSYKYEGYTDATKTASYGYFNRKLNVKFSVDRTPGVKIRFSVYGSSDDANLGENPIFDFTGTNNLVPEFTLIKSNAISIDVSPYLFESGGNELIENLSLIPGGTYYLRIDAMEGANSRGYAYKSFTIPSGNVNTTILATDRSKDSVTFSVSVFDAINTIVGYHGTDADFPANVKDFGLYTVRFERVKTVAGAEVREFISTIYDDKLYSINDIAKHKFVLSNDTTKNTSIMISPDTVYAMKVFAVIDEDLDGLSNKIDSDDTKYTWEQFFGLATATENIDGTYTYKSSAFTDFIDSFWTKAHTINESMVEISDGFKIGEYTAKTTSTSNIYIGNASFSAPNSKTLKLELEESAGIAKIVNKQTVQTFDRILCTVSKRNGSSSNLIEITDPSKMFTINEADDTYSLSIDVSQVGYTLTRGRYNIQIKFYKGSEEYAISQTVDLTIS